MDAGTVAILGAFGALITAIVSGTVVFLKTRQGLKESDHKMQQEADASGLEPLREALRMRKEEQERLSGQVTKLSHTVDTLLTENTDCHLDLTNLHSWAGQSYRTYKRMCKQLGIKDEDMDLSTPPDMKPRHPRVEFEARTAQQAAVLVQAGTAAGVVQPPAMPPAQPK